MSQDYQRKPRSNPQLADLDHDTLVEALSSALLQATQKNAGQQQQQPAPDSVATIDLMELFYFLLARVKYIILAALLGTFLFGLYGHYTVVPQYQATAKLYIVNSSGLQVSMADLQLASSLTMDYQEVFKTWEVHEMVRSELNLDYTYTQMQAMLTVTNPADTRLLYITVRHTDPQLAMEIANAYARAAKTFIYQVMEGAEPNEFSIALVPGTSVGMGKSSYMSTGFMLGTVLTCGVLVLQFVLDDRPHTPEDITKMANIPTLAVIPRETGPEKSRKVRRPRKESKA